MVAVGNKREKSAHSGGGFACPKRLVGPVVKVSASRAESCVRIPLAPGFFPGRAIPMTQKLALLWLPCQAPGVIGSALGLVGLVSVYCDCMR